MSLKNVNIIKKKNNKILRIKEVTVLKYLIVFRVRLV